MKKKPKFKVGDTVSLPYGGTATIHKIVGKRITIIRSCGRTVTYNEEDLTL